MKIFVIGSGNIAYHMVRAIWKSDHILEGLYSRNESEARSCTRGEKVDLYHDISKITTTSDIYLICVSDDAIASIVTNLPIEIRKKKIVAHTSGSQALEILSDINHKHSPRDAKWLTMTSRFVLTLMMIIQKTRS
jgi:3-hydroxyisobutyrate dehydrogenase-like beta-hydroxyacid dehydrogenase